MSAKCTSTLIIGGLEYKIQSSKISKNSSLNDIIVAIVKEHGTQILKDISSIKGEYSALNINDIANVRGNSTFGDIVSHLNTLGRQYIPVRDGLKVLINKLSKIVPVSEQNILWVSSSITLNGVKVPEVNITNQGDLVILDSNNLNSIYNTMREYFYRKTINTPEKITELVKFIGMAGRTMEGHNTKSEIWFNTLKDKFIEMRKNPATAIHYITSDSTINELIDDLRLRGDLNKLLRDLTNVQLVEETAKQWWITWEGSAGTYTNKNGEAFKFNFKDLDTNINTYLQEKGIEANPEELIKTKAVLLSGISSGHPLSADEIYNLWDEFTKKGCE